MPPGGGNLLCGATIHQLSKNFRATRSFTRQEFPHFDRVEEYKRIIDWNALQQLSGVELAIVLLFLVRANELCQTTRDDFHLLRP
jgi:hypothetical protein